MDYSKLPKLSDTQRNPDPGSSQSSPGEQPIGVRPLDYAPGTQPGPGFAEAWISVGVGVLLLFLSSRLLTYLFKRSAFTWTFTDKTGNPLAYTDSAFYLCDLGLAIFAVALIIEGVMIVAWKRPIIVLLAFLCSAGAGLVNVWVIVKTNPEIGFQILNGLAVIFSGYMAAYQWRVLTWLRRFPT